VPVIHRHKERCSTFFSQRIGARLKAGAANSAVLERRGVTDGDTSTPAAPGHAFARDGSEIRDV